MKRVIITEGFASKISADYVLDLKKSEVHRCCGCWNCWLKTPGRCAYKELDTFYYQYLQADEAIFLVKIEKGFVTSQVKALFERMSPLYLPYVKMGEVTTMHVPRYPHYPNVRFLYSGSFEDAEERKVFEGYIARTFEQFHSKLIELKPYGKVQEEGEVE